MNEEAISTKPSILASIEIAIAELARLTHFSRRISPGSKFRPLPQNFPGSAAPIWAAPGAAPGNSSYCPPQAQGKERLGRPSPIFDARKVSVLLCALRLIALAHIQSRCQMRHVAPQVGEARALVRISARRVKIAFSSACAVIPKWRLVAARPPGAAVLPPDMPRRPAPDRRHHPRPTGDKPGNSRGPRIRRHDGAGPQPGAAESQGSHPSPKPQARESGVALDEATLRLKRVFLSRVFLA